MYFGTARTRLLAVSVGDVVGDGRAKRIYDGRTTLHPSIGNWNFPCRSHYWIRRDRVEWAPAWSDEEIRMGRAQDRRAKELYFESLSDPLEAAPSLGPTAVRERALQPSAWRRFKKWWKD